MSCRESNIREFTLPCIPTHLSRVKEVLTVLLHSVAFNRSFGASVCIPQLEHSPELDIPFYKVRFRSAETGRIEQPLDEQFGLKAQEFVKLVERKATKEASRVGRESVGGRDDTSASSFSIPASLEVVFFFQKPQQENHTRPLVNWLGRAQNRVAFEKWKIRLEVAMPSLMDDRVRASGSAQRPPLSSPTKVKSWQKLSAQGKNFFESAKILVSKIALSPRQSAQPLPSSPTVPGLNSSDASPFPPATSPHAATVTPDQQQNGSRSPAVFSRQNNSYPSSPLPPDVQMGGMEFSDDEEESFHDVGEPSGFFPASTGEVAGSPSFLPSGAHWRGAAQRSRAGSSGGPAVGGGARHAQTAGGQPQQAGAPPALQPNTRSNRGRSLQQQPQSSHSSSPLQAPLLTSPRQHSNLRQFPSPFSLGAGRDREDSLSFSSSYCLGGVETEREAAGVAEALRVLVQTALENTDHLPPPPEEGHMYQLEVVPESEGGSAFGTAAFESFASLTGQALPSLT
uniref:Uncharacterized protein n=1 Tax=Chromera velia CCMP2878 TaxID=1169474 RepID=A0A0G4F723_9ALVE|eukprot:Cvel_15581.t1-p1 / transcript=Cvel_15581.t1 / gene=Cvel_15581 / organism=Chromera_velia_CCMP2878 / gene_product=hypothetical protein / transcript_product=hypothetical protein / location=Cvel_scaffold1158:51491-53679(+) / protein_length=510 / sequence_SO=supercontig / SO=protein_coding / is_pseudo=false